VGNLTVNKHAPLPTPPLEAIERPVTSDDYWDWEGADSIGSWNTDDQYYYEQEEKRLDKWDESVSLYALGEPEENQFVMYAKPVRFYEYVMPYFELLFGYNSEGHLCVPEAFGYTLLDLDEDGQEELILLATMEAVIFYEDGLPFIAQDNPYWIFGVFTIKNDALFCVMRSSDCAFYNLGKNGKIYCRFSAGAGIEGRARLHMRPSDGRLVVEEFWSTGREVAYVNDKMDIRWLNGDDTFETYRNYSNYSKYYDWSRIAFISIGTWNVVGTRDYCYPFSGRDEPKDEWDYFIPNEDWRPSAN